MNTRLVIPILVLGALAFACAPRTRTESLSASTPTTLMTVQRVVPRRVAPDVKLAAKLDVQAETKGLQFDFSVTNTSKKRVELQFPSGQKYEFVVVDSVGREVWRWTKGRMFTQAIRNELLDAGETLSIKERWENVAKAGRYTAIATLNSSNYPVEQRTDFVIR